MKVEFNLVGMTFTEGYPANLIEIDQVHPRSSYDKKIDVPVILEREPDNKFDANAIAVLHNGVKLGHVDRTTASFLAPKLDKGNEIKANIVSINLVEGHGDKPGATIEVNVSK